MNCEVIRILIVDDHMMVREGIKCLLARFDDLNVAGEAVDGEDAVRKVRDLSPDVVLMDLVMPVMDGIKALRLIKESDPEVSVLALTSFTTDDLLFPALRAGAVGYILKDTDPRDLVRSIRDAHRGETTLHPCVARKVIQGLYRPQEQDREHDPLTDRESEVLKLVSEGLTNQEIAKRLFISQPTVRTHVSNILAKLQVTNRVQAALYAIKVGMVDSDGPGSGYVGN